MYCQERIPLLLILGVLWPFTDGEINKLKVFLDSRSVRDLFAYLIVKAGSMYGLLNDNQAENARKEVLIGEFSVDQQV